MELDQFKDVVTFLHKEEQAREEWVDTIPLEIRDVFFDNTYTNSQGLCNDKLIEACFGELAEDVRYFLSEDAIIGENNIFVEDRSYCVYDLETYFDYAEKELFNTKPNETDEVIELRRQLDVAVTLLDGAKVCVELFGGPSPAPSQVKWKKDWLVAQYSLLLDYLKDR